MRDSSAVERLSHTQEVEGATPSPATNLTLPFRGTEAFTLGHLSVAPGYIEAYTMPGWQGSTRRQRLPSNWSVLRKRVLTRDGYRCQWTTDLGVCGSYATDVDHVINGDDHSENNLRSLCSYHHRIKSAKEGNGSARRVRVTIRRPRGKHPGLIDSN